MQQSRRMQVLQIESVKEYVQVLEDQPEESDRLFKDLLIGVTHFSVIRMRLRRSAVR